MKAPITNDTVQTRIFWEHLEAKKSDPGLEVIHFTLILQERSRLNGTKMSSQRSISWITLSPKKWIQFGLKLDMHPARSPLETIIAQIYSKFTIVQRECHRKDTMLHGMSQYIKAMQQRNCKLDEKLRVVEAQVVSMRQANFCQGKACRCKSSIVLGSDLTSSKWNLSDYTNQAGRPWA